MGMFDNPRPIGEVIPNDTPFILHDVTLGPIVPTQYGDAQLVHFKVESKRAPGRTTLVSGIGKAYTALAERKDPRELPMEVKLVLGEAKPPKAAPKLVVPVNYVETSPGVWENPDGADGSQSASASPTSDDDIPF